MSPRFSRMPLWECRKLSPPKHMHSLTIYRPYTSSKPPCVKEAVHTYIRYNIELKLKLALSKSEAPAAAAVMPTNIITLLRTQVEHGNLLTSIFSLSDLSLAARSGWYWAMARRNAWSHNNISDQRGTWTKHRNYRYACFERWCQHQTQSHLFELSSRGYWPWTCANTNTDIL